MLTFIHENRLSARCAAAVPVRWLGLMTVKQDDDTRCQCWSGKQQGITELYHMHCRLSGTLQNCNNIWELPITESKMSVLHNRNI